MEHNLLESVGDFFVVKRDLSVALKSDAKLLKRESGDSLGEDTLPSSPCGGVG